MTVPSQPKYKVNDRVRIRQVLKTSNRHVMINGKYVSAKIRKGVIKEVTLKQNSCGAKIPHYQVLWDHQSSPSLVSQHRIELENEDGLLWDHQSSPSLVSQHRIELENEVSKM